MEVPKIFKVAATSLGLMAGVVTTDASLKPVAAQSSFSDPAVQEYSKNFDRIQTNPIDLKDILNLFKDASDKKITGDVGQKESPVMSGLLKRAGLASNYDTRLALAIFLASQGINLFPPNHGSESGTSYSGSADQNSLLESSLAKNIHLFVGGNLTKEAAKKWVK